MLPEAENSQFRFYIKGEIIHILERVEKVFLEKKTHTRAVICLFIEEVRAAT